MEQGIARIQRSEKELRDIASRLIGEARKQTETLMKQGLIKQPPKAKGVD